MTAEQPSSEKIKARIQELLDICLQKGSPDAAEEIGQLIELGVTPSQYSSELHKRRVAELDARTAGDSQAHSEG